ncbi:MAG TPA: glycosyltransferase 87 family protein [Terracidiphilus sp.]|nr:glycosyltransferase 87 family protein [Terracidiphilus sp.]
MTGIGTRTGTAGRRLTGALLLLVCGGISLWWGVLMWRDIPGGLVDFQVVYYGTRTMMDHRDPYDLRALKETYRVEAAAGHAGAVDKPEAVTWFLYLPTIFPVVAPFALLPWRVARMAWFVLLAALLATAVVRMWQEGAREAPGMALLLACLMLLNCEVLFGGGNSAGIAVSLCVLGAWYFVKERHAALGVACMAVSLAIKPHDAGLVWLYFLLAGGSMRRRAVETLGAAALIGVAALVWTHQAVPQWMQEWRANVAAISAPGHTSDPGAVTAKELGITGPVIDLQSVVAAFRDEASVYEPAALAICGGMLLVWVWATARQRMQRMEDAWLGLAAAAPLTLLATYHRPYDATLLLLAIPACAALWARGDWTGRIALVLTAAGAVLTGSLAVAALFALAWGLPLNPATWNGRMGIVLLTRAPSLVLLAMAVFYLWVYARRAGNVDTAEEGSQHALREGAESA